MTHRVFPSRLLQLLIVCLAISFSSASYAQDAVKTQAPANPTPVKASTKNKETTAANKAKADQRKALGLSLLVSLANEARNFADQKLRARTLSRIADALWEPDPEQGRTLFRKAWDAADAADQESARRVEEDRKRQEGENPKGGGYTLVSGPDLRGEVLRLAAKRDRALGEEFLDKLTEARKQEAADAANAASANPLDTSAAVRQRLRLANQLLETDVERAIQFADPALGAISMDALDFLSSLRNKNPAAADQRFARMLAVADTDVKSDANVVSILSSYLFTPHLFITFSPDGGQNSSSMNQHTPPPEVAPDLRAAFFRTSAGILLRPLPPKEQDHSTSGFQGKFLVIKRLLPLFEQYAPKVIADQLRGEMSVLGQGVEQDVRDMDDEYPLQRGITPDRKAEDVEKSLLDRIDHARTSEERDALYMQLATRTAQRGDLRARDFTEKIEDSELRKKVQPYVDMELALSAVAKKDVEKSLFLVSKGDLSQIQKVWLLTQTAKAMPAADHEKALDLVADATAEARRIDVSDPDRPRALVAVADALAVLERPRAWELMLEVAKASNSAEAYTGEDGLVTMRLQTKNMTSVHSSTVDEFNLRSIFRPLAQENANQAVEIARSFEREAPRANALIAVARALLAEKTN
ncbi:MAG TPA: hypothetical protein VLL54_00805 [Pyrinomonadaceae bacterium]|nr:hypothetical protein [Pyrinomonadaceae bacterium]